MGRGLVASYVNDPREPAVSGPTIPTRSHPYQKDAVEQVHGGVPETYARGQLDPPLRHGQDRGHAFWIAEQQVGTGRHRVLYLVPSIALMAQTMREWSAQKDLRLRYMGICSDTRAGRNDEDANSLLWNWTTP